MSFDPTFPPHGAGLASAPWRDQFNSLKDLIDAQAAQILDLTQQLNDWGIHITTIEGQLGNFLTQADVEPIAANNIDGTPELGLTLSDPPVTSELQQLLDKLNETIVGLHR